MMKCETSGRQLQKLLNDLEETRWEEANAKPAEKPEAHLPRPTHFPAMRLQ